MSTTAPTSVPRVVEKYYSPRELSFLLGFNAEFFRDQAKAGGFTFSIEGTVACEPLEIGGELRIPASAVNAWLARHPYRYDGDVKARNAAELKRKLTAA